MIANWIDADHLSPGDTIVVPAKRGGADKFGWNPDPKKKNLVSDIGDLAAFHARGRPVLRIHPDVIRSWQPETQDDDGTLARRCCRQTPLRHEQ